MFDFDGSLFTDGIRSGSSNGCTLRVCAAHYSAQYSKGQTENALNPGSGSIQKQEPISSGAEQWMAAHSGGDGEKDNSAYTILQ